MKEKRESYKRLGLRTRERERGERETTTCGWPFDYKVGPIHKIIV